ncbi:MAG: hypothetical protein ACRDPV_08315 [Gaiellaceae bacterium]
MAAGGGGDETSPAVASDNNGGAGHDEAGETKGDDGESGEDSDQSLTGASADKAAEAALAVSGGGTVVNVESDDDAAGYEVEIRKADGSDVEVELDNGFNVVQREDD